MYCVQCVWSGTLTWHCSVVNRPCRPRRSWHCRRRRSVPSPRRTVTFAWATNTRTRRRISRRSWCRAPTAADQVGTSRRPLLPPRPREGGVGGKPTSAGFNLRQARIGTNVLSPLECERSGTSLCASLDVLIVLLVKNNNVAQNRCINGDLYLRGSTVVLTYHLHYHWGPNERAGCFGRIGWYWIVCVGNWQSPM